MTKTMEICKVRNGERFIVDGEEFVKLGEVAGGVFVLLVGTLPDYCAFESEERPQKILCNRRSSTV